MATWQVFVTDQATNGVDPNVTLVLDGALGVGSPPGDYSPANITSIDLFLSLTGAGWSDDSWGAGPNYWAQGAVDTLATGAISTSGNQNVTVTDGPDTDGSPTAGETPVRIRAALTYAKTKGADGGSVRMDNASYLIITYTPISTEPEFLQEEGTEADTADDLGLAPEQLLNVEEPTETDTSADAFFGAEPVFVVEEATETDTPADQGWAPELWIDVETGGGGATVPGHFLLDGTDDELIASDAVLDSLVGAFSLYALLAPDDWTPASWQPIISKQSSASDEEWYWQLRDAGAGASFMRFEGYDATDTQVVVQNSNNFTPSGAHAHLRVDFLPDNGASQHELRWFWSEDPTNTAYEDITWTAIGVDQVGGAVTLKDSTTAPTRLGGSSFANSLAGKYFAARLASGVGESVADAWTGNNGDPWDAAVWDVTSGGGTPTTDIQSNKGRMAIGGATDIAQASTDESWEYAVEVLVRCTRGVNGNNRTVSLGNGAWSTGGEETHTGYFVYQQHVSPFGYRLARMSGGSYQGQIGSDFAAATTDDWIRFRREGSALKVKVWAVGSPEPEFWSIETTDANFNGPYFGQLAAFGSNSGAFNCDWDDFEIAPVLKAAADFRTAQSYEYTWLEASGARLESVDDAALDFNNDLDVRVGIKFKDILTTGGDEMLASRWEGVANERHFTFYRDSASGAGDRLHFISSADGATISVNQLSDAGLARSDRYHYRVTLDLNNGSGQKVVTFYYSDEPADTPRASITWQQWSQHTIAGTTSLWATGSNGLSLGERIDAPGEDLIGQYLWAEVRNGINGTVVEAVDYRTGQERFLALDGVDDDVLTAYTSAYNLASDLDVRADVQSWDWTKDYATMLARQGPANYYFLTHAIDKRLRLEWYNTSDVFKVVTSDAVLPVNDGDRVQVRAVLDLDVGGTTHEVTFYYRTDTTKDITDHTGWTQLGTAQTASGGGVTSIRGTNTSTGLYIGNQATVGSEWPGRIYQTALYDGIAGTLVHLLDNRTKTAAPTTDDTGQSLTYRNGAALGWPSEVTDLFWSFRSGADWGQWGGYTESWDPQGDAVWVAPAAGGTPDEVDTAFEAFMETVTEPTVNAEEGTETDTSADITLVVEPAFDIEEPTETDTTGELVFWAEPIFGAEEATEADTAADTEFGPVVAIDAEEATETDTSVDVVLSAEPRASVEEATEADTSTDVTLSVEPVFVVEEPTETDTSADMDFGPVVAFDIEELTETDTPADLGLLPEPVVVVEEPTETDTPFDIVLEAASAQPQFYVESATETDTTGDAFFGPAQTLSLEGAAEADTPQEANLLTEPVFVLEEASEAGLASDLGLSPEPLVVLAWISETSTAAEFVLSTDALTFYLPDPVGATPARVGSTPNPVAAKGVRGPDTPPW